MTDLARGSVFTSGSTVLGNPPVNFTSRFLFGPANILCRVGSEGFVKVNFLMAFADPDQLPLCVAVGVVLYWEVDGNRHLCDTYLYRFQILPE